MSFERIPAELRERPQWVVWRTETRDEKPTKVPHRADGLGRADSTDPTTWASFSDAVAAISRLGMDGVGFVFSEQDPYTGVDLDDCLVAGALHPAAADIVRSLDSYAEISPSGHGVKIIVRASKNGNTRCRTSDTPWGGKLEVYEFDRFFTITGAVLPRAMFGGA